MRSAISLCLLLITLSTCAVPSGWKSAGCYNSDSPTQLLQFLESNTTSMTWASCTRSCASRKYLFSGMTEGRACFCGNTLVPPVKIAPAADCNLSCSGKSSQACGGFRRLSLFNRTAPYTPTTTSSTSKPVSLASTKISTSTKPVTSAESSSPAKTSTSTKPPTVSTTSLRPSSTSATLSSLTVTKLSSSVRSSTSTKLPAPSPTSGPVVIANSTQCLWYPLGNQVVSLNKTDPKFTYAHYGALDSHGFPSRADSIGIWNKPVDSVVFPDMLIDLSDASKISIIYQNGTRVVVDTAAQRIIFDDCERHASYPLPTPIPEISSNHARALKELPKRDVYTPQATIKVTLSYTNKCNDPVRNVYPCIFCQPVSTSSFMDSYPVVDCLDETSPGSGTYATTCKFPPTADSRQNSAGCKVLYPVLLNLCEANKILQTGAPGFASAICLPLLADPFTAPLYAWCPVALSALNLYCNAQSMGNGGNDVVQRSLCGPTDTSSSLKIYTGTTNNFDETLSLGTQSSLHPANIVRTIKASAPQGLTCGPCINGKRLAATPFTPFYAGNLGIRPGYQDDDCAEYVQHMGDNYGTIVNASSVEEATQIGFQDADTKADTVVIISDLHYVVYYGNSNPDPAHLYNYHDWSCPMETSDFQNVDDRNLNQKGFNEWTYNSIAYNRTASFEAC